MRQNTTCMQNLVTDHVAEKKFKPEKFLPLARSSEVNEIISLLEDLFSSDTEVPELCGPPEIAFGVPDQDGRDPGVGPESTMSYGELCSNLGLDEFGRLPLFNEFQHSSKESPWSKSGEKLFKKYEELGDTHPHASEFSPSKLHYHQLAGMHSTLRQMLGTERTVLNPMGFLIADSPGLGKTRMSAAVALWLVTCGLKQDFEASVLPPLLGEYIAHLPAA